MDAPGTSTALEQAPVCTHFGQCGGCTSQHEPYREQVLAKELVLRNLFQDFWREPIEVLPSPVIWHYRNKVDFNFALKRYDEPPPKNFPRETVLGFNRKGKWYWPLDISECHIAPEGVARLLEAVRGWYRDARLTAYDARSGQGLLRVLLVREATHTGQKMVVLITAEGELDESRFVSAVLEAYEATSIYRGIYRGAAQGAFADELRLLCGSETIEERLDVPDDGGIRSLRFRISPLSFFQTNTLATEVLYGEIRRWVKDLRPAVLYDLYGGAGGIALTCADLAGVVRSVESVESATMDGRTNAALNGVNNVFFTCADARTYLRGMIETGGMEPNSAAVVDPPRAGLNPKVVKHFVEAGPPQLLYVSCKPSVFAQELPLLHEAYTLASLRGVDLFPHTPHVELIATLERR